VSVEVERAVATLTLDYNLLTPEKAVRLIAEARKSSRSLVSFVLAEVAEADILKTIAKEFGWEYIDLHGPTQQVRFDEGLLQNLDVATLTKLAALPLRASNGNIVVAMANPTDMNAQSYLDSYFPQGYTPALAAKAQVQSRLLYVSNDFETDPSADNAVPAWIDYLLQRAVADRASDILFGFLHDGSLLVRFNIDGTLHQLPVPLPENKRNEVIPALLARCSSMDQTNVLEPQDGTFSYTVAGRQIDARVGLIPQMNGPGVAVRILDSATLRTRPEDMGFSPQHLEIMRKSVQEPQGCVVVVGPTGSGKTTTLYTLLREVDALARNVLTVEDPVEYRLPYVGQTQIRTDIGDRSLTWPRALRALLRQAPNVILVGEIRDAETAQIAMEASITGHLVLTTLHARSAPGAYLRLSEMGVQPYMTSEAITLLINQRLVGKVHDCATSRPPTIEEKHALETMGLPIYPEVAQPNGCPGCNGRGYLGRLAVSELLVPDDAVRTAVNTRAERRELHQAAYNAGWRPIVSDAGRLIEEKRTTVSQVAAIILSEFGDLSFETTEL